MSDKNELQKVSYETMRFMRGKYMLDEVSNAKDQVTFCDGDQTILTIYIRDGYYDFQVEQNRVKVFDMDSLEIAKKMILSRMEPNRKPFPREQAVYGDCGHRCDLCVHYSGGTISDEFRVELVEGVRRIYNPSQPYEEAHKVYYLCPGCKKAHENPIAGISPHTSELCNQKKCAADKGICKCIDCHEYPCNKATVGYRHGIEARSISAHDVTWAILPWVEEQYGN